VLNAKSLVVVCLNGWRLEKTEKINNHTNKFLRTQGRDLTLK